MIERQTIAQNGVAERAILVGVCTRDMTFEQAKDYLDFIEKRVGVPIGLVSVGPDREQTIPRDKEIF